jgi:hypothetical protein
MEELKVITSSVELLDFIEKMEVGVMYGNVKIGDVYAIRITRDIQGLRNYDNPNSIKDQRLYWIYLVAENPNPVYSGEPPYNLKTFKTEKQIKGMLFKELSKYLPKNMEL